MHAFIIVGQEEEVRNKKSFEVANSLCQKIYEFPITKIEDVRNLERFTKLSFEVKTAVIIKDADKASPEALNAFLKSLEEPQEKLNFILTSSSEHKLPPTILSRCQIINLGLNLKPNEDLVLNFLKKDTFERLKMLEDVGGREEAISFIKELILSAHSNFIAKRTNSKLIVNLLKAGQKTLYALNANGNLKLQLTNFILNLEE